MTTVYPVILTPAKCGYVVTVPDLEINTQGADMADAIAMARDAIGLWGITEQDCGRTVPKPGNMKPVCEDGELVSLIDIDFDAYRRANDTRAVRRNVTLPSWLDDKASKAGVNVSGVLQRALMQELGVQDRV